MSEYASDKPRPVGRPSKLTPEVQEKICEALTSGNFRSVAAWHAGISEKTFYSWMNEGEASPDTPMGDFYRAVIEAEKAAEIRIVGIITKAAEADPKHGEWWLSHRHAARWAEKRNVKLSGQVQTGPLSEVPSEKLTGLKDALKDTAGKLDE